MKNSISLRELASRLGTDWSSICTLFEDEQMQHLLSGSRVMYHNFQSVLNAYTTKYKYQNKKWSIPDWLYADSSDWAQTLVEMYAEPVAYPASLPPSQGKIVHDLILQHKPANVVEIGCFIGISSVWIGSALKKLGRGHLYSVDLFFSKFPDPPSHWGFLEVPLAYAQKKIKKAKLTNYVDPIQTKSAAFAKQFNKRADQKIDLLFIDGDHTVGGCVDDFLSFYPLVREGGKILLHDIYPEKCGWAGPRYLLDQLAGDASSFKINEIETEPNYGIALITKITEDKRFYPWHNPKMEAIRIIHRAQAKLGYTSFYQTRIKPRIKWTSSLLSTRR